MVDQALDDFRAALRALADMALLESAAALLNKDETPFTPFIFALDERTLKRVASLARDELRFRKTKAPEISRSRDVDSPGPKRTTMSIATASTVSPVDTNEGYIVLENMIRDRIVMRSSGPLFTTSASPEALWAGYLNGFPEANRKHYDCHSCRRFIQTYGGLVTISKDGTAKSLLWDGDGQFGDDVPPFFFASLKAMCDLVDAAKVTGVFLSSETTWGAPSTPDKKRAGVTWTHFSGRNAKIYSDRLLTADQRMAEKLEDYKMLKRALADYGAPVAEQAVRVLKSDALTRSEKALGIAEWFAGLHGQNGNQLWLAVATAPPGYCHVRSTMISTLLDDIVAGLPFETISRRWAEKMHPLAYQRPTAAPKEGAIEAAEKLVAKLGVAKSLERRFAKLEDIQVKLWEPKPAAPAKAKADGVFGHLRGQSDAVKDVALPPTTMTWEKFAKTVLPTARHIEVKVPSVGMFYGLVTAADPEAPPIIQWDRPEKRNPVSWYTYSGGSSASQWGLVASTWTKVPAVFVLPAHWSEPEKAKHHAEGAVFALEGANDSKRDSLALFNEILKSEFHGIRSVIEAHSKKGAIQGDGTANGLVIRKDGSGGFHIRVDGSAIYILDRWD